MKLTESKDNPINISKFNCTAEIIQNSWKIVYDNRTNVRSRLKAIIAIKECYKHEMEMLGTEET